MASHWLPRSINLVIDHCRSTSLVSVRELSKSQRIQGVVAPGSLAREDTLSAALFSPLRIGLFMDFEYYGIYGKEQLTCLAIAFDDSRSPLMNLAK